MTARVTCYDATLRGLPRQMRGGPREEAMAMHIETVHHADRRDLADLDAAFAGPRPYLFDNY